MVSGNRGHVYVFWWEMAKIKMSSSLWECIQQLGGYDEDMQLLAGVDSDSNSEMEFNEEGANSNELAQDEVANFLSDLGLKKKANVKNTKPKKEPAENGDTKKQKKKVQNKDKPSSRSTSDMGPQESSDGRQLEKLEKQLLSLSAKPYGKLLVPPDSEQVWFEQSSTDEAVVLVGPKVLAHLSEVGQELMKREVQLYEQVRQKRKGASDVKWLKTVLSSGTLSDKMAALTLLVQESPVHTHISLDSLISMASKKGKRECVLAVDTLKELWISDLLPEQRKLKSLKQRPLNLLVSKGYSILSRHRMLLLWYFEEQLKSKYAQFLTTLTGLSHDTVANVREKMLGHIFDLLYHKPEQEQLLLSQLVNKLGDPIAKIASKSLLFLLKLLIHHVNMKTVVAREIEYLLHRPNISPKAQYYGVCCLNQFTIGPNDEPLAVKLVEIYFCFFKLFLKRDQLDAKMLGALLTGVNRAFPYLKGELPAIEDHLQSLFKVVHVGPLATGIQSLMLLFQVMESRQAVSGRYYQALYSKLMDPALKHSGKQALFLNLLFKSLKSDPELNRVKAFLKRILQVCSLHSPPIVCGCLYLISEVLKVKPMLWSFILQSEYSDKEHFTDIPEDNNQEAVSSDQSPPDEVPEQDQDHVMSSETQVTSGESRVTENEAYRIAYRNPLYARAETTSLWELTQLISHYHPSVQAFAKRIASGEYIDYKGDPLQDFTLMRFLDRFVYKNPKKRVSDHGGSLMQRASKLLEDSQMEVLVNSSEFAALDTSKVREEELFMHRYFVQKAAVEATKKKKKKKKKEEEGGGPGELPEGGDDEVTLGEKGFKMDFAGELERQVKGKKQAKKRKKKHLSDSEQSDSEDQQEGTLLSGDEDSESEMYYDAPLSDDDESLIGAEEKEGGGEPTEAEVEKMLLDNLSGSEDDIDLMESEDGGASPPHKKKKNKTDRKTTGGFDPATMFAAAEEFAHLLEESETSTRYGATRDGASEKQLKWEEKKTFRGRGGKGRYRGGGKKIRTKFRGSSSKSNTGQRSGLKRTDRGTQNHQNRRGKARPKRTT